MGCGDQVCVPESQPACLCGVSLHSWADQGLASGSHQLRSALCCCSDRAVSPTGPWPWRCPAVRFSLVLRSQQLALLSSLPCSPASAVTVSLSFLVASLFCFLEPGSCCTAQASLGLSVVLSLLLSAGIKGVSHHAQQQTPFGLVWFGLFETSFCV